MACLTPLQRWNEDSTWWHWTYFVDWGLALVPMVIWVPLHFNGPRCREFDPLDPSISHPYVEKEMFPNWVLPLVAWVAPLAVGMLLVYGKRQDSRVCIAHEAHSLCLTVTQAFLLALAITDPMKNFAGRHRPDFVSRLERELNFTPAAPPEGYMAAVCGSRSQVVWDGMRSFPSGHSSLAFAGWTVLGMLVTSRIPMHARRAVGYWRVMAVCACFILPSVVAMSRTIDNRHNYGDILAGALIGVFAGAVVFQQHYTLSSEYPINRQTGTCGPASEAHEEIMELSISSPVEEPPLGREP
eukprot:TRINITY_DN46918_c0_g1_i1.p1 TRINITY_DN46918_c0_g1~~TRINITY_DN46918_c0_g1_i1.p1  ORF type:complete len:315 (+),score=57.08 TRINITY_DN46918_c0_g1_i1:52-945(+)